jgi:hypothetical protein
MRSREFAWIDRQKRRKAVNKFLATKSIYVTRTKYELEELLKGVTADEYEEIFTDIQGEEKI